MGAADVVVIGVALARKDSGLHVNVLGLNVADFGGRSAGGVEAFVVGGKQVAERVPQRLDNVRAAVLLVPVEIQTGKLAGADEEFVVRQCLFEPLGVEAGSIGTDQTTGFAMLPI